MEIWEPKPPGTLWATPGLLGKPLPLPLVLNFNLLRPGGYFRLTACTNSSFCRQSALKFSRV